MSIKGQFVSEIIKKMFDFNPEHKKLIAGTDEEPFFFHISRGPQKGSLRGWGKRPF